MEVPHLQLTVTKLGSNSGQLFTCRKLLPWLSINLRTDDEERAARKVPSIAK